jgi:urea transporter
MSPQDAPPDSEPREDLSVDLHVDLENAVKIWLRGLGQVMFQRHAGTGLLFLVGVSIGSPWLAGGAALGGAIGPLVAWLLRRDRVAIADGLYGYNSALVGAAAGFFLPLNAVTIALAAGGAALAVPVTGLLRRLPFPAYTAAFVVVAWGMLILAGDLDDRLPASVAAETVLRPGWAGLAEEVFAGLAEVMFSAHAASGLCFLAGIAWSAWRHAVVAVVGALLGTCLAIYHGDPAGQLALGIYGYNAALAAMAAWLARPSLVPAAVAAFVSVPLTEFFPSSFGVPALTAPFIMAAWIVLLLLRLDRSLSTSEDSERCT